jgi:hypothetical protein
MKKTYDIGISGKAVLEKTSSGCWTVTIDGITFMFSTELEALREILSYHDLHEDEN